MLFSGTLLGAAFAEWTMTRSQGNVAHTELVPAAKPKLNMSISKLQSRIAQGFPNHKTQTGRIHHPRHPADRWWQASAVSVLYRRLLHGNLSPNYVTRAWGWLSTHPPAAPENLERSLKAWVLYSIQGFGLLRLQGLRCELCPGRLHSRTSKMNEGGRRTKVRIRGS